MKIRLIALVGIVGLGFLGVQDVIGDDRSRTEMILSNLQKIMPDTRALTGEDHVDQGTWRAEEISGDVVYQDEPGGDWKRLSVGDVIEAGTSVETESGGWAVLGRGKDRIAVAGGTSLTFPEQSPNGDTSILQDQGSALFQVDKKPGRAFEVETPFLTAGVKGTVFGVSVSNAGAEVTVTEGRVSVSPASGRKSIDVTIGLTARVAPGPRADVAVGPTGKTPGATQGKALGKAQAPGQGISPGRANAFGNSENSGGNGNGGGNSGGGNSGGGNGGGGNGGGGNGGGGNGGGGNGGGGNGGGGNGGGGNGGGGNGGGNGGNGGGNGKGKNG